MRDPSPGPLARCTSHALPAEIFKGYRLTMKRRERINQRSDSADWSREQLHWQQEQLAYKRAMGYLK